MKSRRFEENLLDGQGETMRATTLPQEADAVSRCTPNMSLVSASGCL